MLCQKCRPDPDVLLSIVKRKDLTLKLSYKPESSSNLEAAGDIMLCQKCRRDPDVFLMFCRKCSPHLDVFLSIVKRKDLTPELWRNRALSLKHPVYFIICS